MIQALVVLFFAIPAPAATTPLEADFPEGYWERETGMYGERFSASYNVSIVVEDPAKARAEVQAALKIPGAKLTNFMDQTTSTFGNEYPGRRARPAYTIAYQVPEGKAAAVAHKLIELGRLMSYNVQTPFAAPQKKEIDDRIEWIEKEMRNSAEALKTMPVSRAMLESKLKKLRASLDMVKATTGVAMISVQITREDPESGTKPASAAPIH